MIVDNKFDFGDIVYVVTDGEQRPCQITEICVLPSKMIVYVTSRDGLEGRFYDFELSREKDMLTAILNQ